MPRRRMTRPAFRVEALEDRSVPAADLVPVNYYGPAEVAAAADFAVSWDVENRGAAPAASAGWTDAVFLSTDDTLDAGDTYLADFSYTNDPGQPLAPTGVYTGGAVVSGANTAGLDPGTYHLIVAVDYSGAEPEESEGDNLIVAQLTITPAGPDLVTIYAQAFGDFVPGDDYSIDYEVANVGGAAADADYWFDAIYLSADETFDASDTFLAYNYHYNFGSPLQPGDSYYTTATIPGYLTQDGFPSGDLYLIVVADGFGYQAEGDETNNARPAPVAVVPVEDVDLTVTALALDGGPGANVGDFVTLAYTVKNQGTEPAFGAGYYDGWVDIVYLSDDEYLDFNDIAVAYVYPYDLPLDGGAEYTDSVSFQIPSTHAGNRYFLYVTDADNYYYYQPERDGANNLAAVPVALTGPDLTVALDAVADPARPGEPVTSAVLGQTVEVTWTVTNAGDGPANQYWNDSVWLSTSDTPGAGDLYVAEYSQYDKSPLGPNGAYTYSAAVTLPARLAPGDYFLFVGTDYYYGGYNGSHPETDDGNNASAAVPIALRGPDLAVTLDRAPGTANVGDEVTLSWTVTNTAADPALGAWADAVYVSDDETFGGDDTYVASFPPAVHPLDGDDGSYTRADITVRIPSTRGGNPRYLLVVADYGGEHGETGEGNNVAAAPLAPLTGPDLTVAVDGVSADELVVGQQVDITYTVTNGGDGPASGNWSDKIYLGGTYVGLSDPAASAGLAAGGSNTATATVTVPPSFAPGAASFTVVTDSLYGYSGEQPETDDTNNQSAPVGVTLRAPDLTAELTAAPAAAIAGGRVAVGWAVTNGGAVAALGGWTDLVYLSADDVYDPFGDFAIGSRYRPPGDPLAAGASDDGAGTFTLPDPAYQPQYAGGNYYLFVVTDWNNTQGETDDANNVSAAVPIALEANQAPALDPVGDREADTGLELTFAAAAADPNAGLDTLTYFLAGVVPGGAGIDADTGVFSWTPAADLAAQSFTFEVGVRDALGLEDRETITVRVYGPPSEIDLAGGTFAENVPVGTAVGTVTAADPDGDLVSLELEAGAVDNGRFTLTAGGELQTAAGFDFEARSAYTVRVVATDARGRTRTEDFAVAVTDLPERADLVVNGGQAGRSIVRGLAVTVDSPAVAEALLGAGRARLVKRNLNGDDPGVEVDTAGLLSAGGAELRLTWGPQGLGGNRNANAADGYYTLELDLDGDGTRETARSFYRLLGDTGGDRTVTVAGDTGDANGDGVTNAADLLLVRRHQGRSLNPLLPLDG